MGSLYATIYICIYRCVCVYIYIYIPPSYTNPQGRLLNKPYYAHIDDTHTPIAGERQGHETEPGHTTGVTGRDIPSGEKPPTGSTNPRDGW